LSSTDTVAAVENRDLVVRFLDHLGRGAHHRRFAQALRDRADQIGGVTGRSMHLLRTMFGTPLDAEWSAEEAA
jgi:hypothetical protein